MQLFRLLTTPKAVRLNACEGIKLSTKIFFLFSFSLPGKATLRPAAWPKPRRVRVSSERMPTPAPRPKRRVVRLPAAPPHRSAGGQACPAERRVRFRSPRFLVGHFGGG